MNNIISYQKEISFVKRFFGIAFTILGVLMLLLTGSLMTLIFIAIGLGLNTAEGSEINLFSKQFRTFHTLFGIKVGKWLPIPNFEYVSVFKTNESQTVRVITAETTQKYEIIHVNLFYNRNKHITFYKTVNKEDAFEVANHFKLALNIDVLDATENEKKWL
ncbi:MULTISPECIES: hypothetical protein [unclassified Flavobacterium]|uniref:hypothetical protein n=1 Tax=unclassified Flavobacterium TaxID=196869 RepID=UPI001291C0D9|nr:MULTISPECIES: hypothetical protein [unclassified Flavobacterium]MQP51338.1 hypothetical protein [Flavobacterium sp. LMO9]MQP61433.1 hypothetical protein [Flavobacterium sp. LMO6]